MGCWILGTSVHIPGVHPDWGRITTAEGKPKHPFPVLADKWGLLHCKHFLNNVLNTSWQGKCTYGATPSHHGAKELLLRWERAVECQRFLFFTAHPSQEFLKWDLFGVSKLHWCLVSLSLKPICNRAFTRFSIPSFKHTFCHSYTTFKSQMTETKTLS